MLPAITLFGHSISTFYSMMFLGFVLMLVLMIRRRKIYKLNIWQATAFTVLVLFSGILGCKVLYILENINIVLEEGITFGGFSFFGAVFLVPPLMALFGKLFRLSPGKSLNASAICVCAMVGTIRIGCFLNGCCGGNTYHFSNFEFIFPAQLVESVIDFIILAYLIDRENKGVDKLYPRFMSAYASARFIIEFFRDTPKDWLGLSHGQWFSIAALIIAAISIYFTKSSVKKKERVR